MKPFLIKTNQPRLQPRAKGSVAKQKNANSCQVEAMIRCYDIYAQGEGQPQSVRRSILLLHGYWCPAAEKREHRKPANRNKNYTIRYSWYCFVDKTQQRMDTHTHSPSTASDRRSHIPIEAAVHIDEAQITAIKP